MSSVSDYARLKIWIEIASPSCEHRRKFWELARQVRILSAWKATNKDGWNSQWIGPITDLIEELSRNASV